MTETKDSSRRNRGKNSGDDRLFGNASMQKRMREALSDMCFLLSRGYAERSSLALVGNRYRLNARQQQALLGMSASDNQIKSRNERSLTVENIRNQKLAVDGFNLLIILESLLSGAYLFKGSDGFYRDLSSVHGSYKRVHQTSSAIDLVCRFYEECGCVSLHWFFDKPVSNSGRIRQLLEEIARERNYNWEVQLVYNPDREIADSGMIVITSDAWILDQAPMNFNFMEYYLTSHTFTNVLIFNTPNAAINDGK